jgi:hypothetical protein
MSQVKKKILVLTIKKRSKEVKKMTALSEKLKSILKKLEQNSEVFGGAIVNLRGQMMASALMGDIDENTVAAMSAALTSVGLRVGKTLKAGSIKSITLNASDAIVLAKQLKSSVLIALAPADAKIGLIEFEVDQAIEEINKTLK